MGRISAHFARAFLAVLAIALSACCPKPYRPPPGYIMIITSKYAVCLRKYTIVLPNGTKVQRIDRGRCPGHP